MNADGTCAHGNSPGLCRQCAQLAVGRCEHGHDPMSCEQCNTEGLITGGEVWCTDIRLFVVDNEKTGAIAKQPRILIGNPKCTGFTVADSSMQRMVDDARPRMYTITEEEEEDTHDKRSVWVYSIPGATALPGANDFNVSTMAVFWIHCAGLMNKVRFYLVPPKDSVQGNWGASKRTKAVNYMYGKCVGGLFFLPTVKEVMQKLDMKEEDVFFDWAHMTRAASKRIHNYYWLCIRKESKKHDEQTSVPVLIWDFNASTQHMKTAEAQHVNLWSSLVQWGQAESDGKQDFVLILNRMLRSNTRILSEWYSHNRSAIIKYKRGAVTCTLDESNIDITDERDDRLCPGWMPGLVRAERGILASKEMAEADAVTGSWFPDNETKRWEGAIGAVLTHLHGSYDPIWIEKRIRSARGEYRMFFAALVKQTGLPDGNVFLARGAQLVDVKVE